MKLKTKILITLFLVNSIIFAQAPNSMKYQAVARNSEGNILQDMQLDLRFSILWSSVEGIPFYVETQETETNQFGLFSLNIGEGISEKGSFAEIPWGSGNFYLKVEMDAGTGFEYLGTSQLLSVPYALNAGSVTLKSEDGSFYNITVDNNGNLGTEEIVIDTEGNIYPTVKIGNQIWMAKNLNVGTMINAYTGGSNGDGDQTNNQIIEKYCYLNDPAWCDSLGGLYKWNELMNYTTTEGTQGICPDGWHIPTQADWEELIAYFPADSAGFYLKPEGGSGFNTLYSEYFDNGEFHIDATGVSETFFFTEFWTSYFTSNLINIRTLSINYEYLSNYFTINDNSKAVKIRCIKNN